MIEYYAEELVGLLKIIDLTDKFAECVRQWSNIVTYDDSQELFEKFVDGDMTPNDFYSQLSELRGQLELEVMLEVGGDNDGSH